MRINSRYSLHNTPLIYRLIVYWQRVILWLGLEDVTRRRWAARMPAVIVAGIIMAMFVWTVDIGQVDLTLVLCLALLSVAMGLQAAIK